MAKDVVPWISLLQPGEKCIAVRGLGKDSSPGEIGLEITVGEGVNGVVVVLLNVFVTLFSITWLLDVRVELTEIEEALVSTVKLSVEDGVDVNVIVTVLVLFSGDHDMFKRKPFGKLVDDMLPFECALRVREECGARMKAEDH